jgi:hypothetical protein
MTRRTFFAVLAGLVVLAAAGCGKSGPAVYTVSGTVTYDGQTVANGYITFQPEDPTVGAVANPIEGGRYTVPKVHEGKNKVKIQATREVPGKKGPMGEPAVEQYIPRKYNDETTLTAEVGSGKTEHNFALPK